MLNCCLKAEKKEVLLYSYSGCIQMYIFITVSLLGFGT